MHVCKVSLGSLQAWTVHQGLAAPVISPDGKTVILGGMNEIICRNISTRAEIKYNSGGYITNYLKILIMINGLLE